MTIGCDEDDQDNVQNQEPKPDPKGRVGEDAGHSGVPLCSGFVSSHIGFSGLYGVDQRCDTQRQATAKQGEDGIGQVIGFIDELGMGDEHGPWLLHDDGTLAGSCTGLAVIRRVWGRGSIRHGRCWPRRNVQWLIGRCFF